MAKRQNIKAYDKIIGIDVDDVALCNPKPKICVLIIIIRNKWSFIHFNDVPCPPFLSKNWHFRMRWMFSTQFITTATNEDIVRIDNDVICFAGFA